MSETPAVERDSLDDLAEALAKFQAEMPTVPKTKTADTGTYRYKYADLADVTSAAMPLLAKHGLSFVTLPGPSGLIGMLLHTSGQRLTAVLPITGATPQQVGSSLTYMRRYLLGCLTGIVTDDDDDGRAASTPKAQPRKRSEPRPPVAPTLATPENPGPDGSVDVPLPDPSPVPEGLRRAMFAGFRDALPEDVSREDRLEIIAAIVGRQVESSGDLTRDETYRAVGFLERVKVGAAGIVRREGAWHAVTYDMETGAES
jgi:hypothetical protein